MDGHAADRPVGGSLSEETIDRLRAALRGGPPLRFAVLFGSAAAGRLRPGSDVDVAIWPVDCDLPLRAELDLQAALARASGREADLVRLDRATTLVRWEVAHACKPLIEARPGAVARFMADAASEYLDFEPAFQRAAEAFRRALASRHVGV